jgi:hypothetical protein
MDGRGRRRVARPHSRECSINKLFAWGASNRGFELNTQASAKSRRTLGSLMMYRYFWNSTYNNSQLFNTASTLLHGTPNDRCVNDNTAHRCRRTTKTSAQRIIFICGTSFLHHRSTLHGPWVTVVSRSPRHHGQRRASRMPAPLGLSLRCDPTPSGSVAWRGGVRSAGTFASVRSRTIALQQ